MFLMDLLTVTLELVFAGKAVVAAVFATKFGAWELCLWVQAVLGGIVSLEVGPSFRTIDAAVFNASELSLVAEMILFVFASSQLIVISIRILAICRSTEIAA